MIRYSRDVPLRPSAELVVDVETHIRAHLSSVVTADDNPDARAWDARIEYAVVNNELRITGILLSGEPMAPYLQPDWSPAQDVADNPLSVPSVEAA